MNIPWYYGQTTRKSEVTPASQTLSFIEGLHAWTRSNKPACGGFSFVVGFLIN